MRTPSGPSAPAAQPPPITDLAAADKELQKLNAELEAAAKASPILKAGGVPIGGASQALLPEDKGGLGGALPGNPVLQGKNAMNDVLSGLNAKRARRDQLQEFIDKAMKEEDRIRREGGKGRAANILSDQSYRRSGVTPQELNSAAGTVLLQ